MPIVGQFGSLAGFGVFPGGALESIASITVGSGGASSIEFTDIPATYQHLQIRMIMRSTTSNNGFGHRMRFNGNTGTNYSWHSLAGTGSSAVAGAAANETLMYMGVMPGTSNTASAFHASVVDVLDYANTSKNTTIRTFWGNDFNGSGEVQISSGAFYQTAAITSLRFIPDSSLSYAQHTTAALYGVKAP